MEQNNCQLPLNISLLDVVVNGPLPGNISDPAHRLLFSVCTQIHSRATFDFQGNL